jgi:hypothetical protein
MATVLVEIYLLCGEGLITAPTASQPPTVTSGNASLLNFVPPTTSAQSSGPSGYTLENMSYTFVANSLAPITITWASDQPFYIFPTGTAEPDYGVALSGNTTVSFTGICGVNACPSIARAMITDDPVVGDSATFSLTGAIVTGGTNNNPLTTFRTLPGALAGTLPLAWNAGPSGFSLTPAVSSTWSSTTALVGAGSHDLQMSSTVVFTPAAVGDAITVAGTYEVAPASPAPAPAPVPAVPRWAAIALGLFSWRLRASSKGAVEWLLPTDVT